MTLRDILNVLFKRKHIVLFFFLAALIGGYAGLELISPTYAATSQLLVRIGSEDIYMPALSSAQFRTPFMSVVREEQLRSESNILMDAELARKVVAEVGPASLFPGIDIKHPWYTPKGVLQMMAEMYNWLEGYFFPLSSQRTLEDKAVAAFQKALNAEAVKNANTIAVTMRNKSPEAAALGVNTLVKLYLTERVRIHQREQSDFFSAQLTQVDGQIQETDRAIDAFRSRANIVDLDKQRGAQIDQLNDVRQRIDQNRLATAQAASRLQVLRKQLAEVPSTTQLSESSNSMALSELNKQLADIRRREADIALRFSENDPRLSTLREERNVLQKMQEEQTSKQATQRGINPLHARIRDDALQTETALASVRQEAGTLARLEREIMGRLGAYATEDPAYRELLQRGQVLRETRQLYLEKSEEARLAAAQAAARIGNVSVISHATPDTRPVSPKLWLVLIGVLVGGLLGGIGLAFLVEFFDDGLRSDADVLRYLKLPLLAKVPDLAV